MILFNTTFVVAQCADSDFQNWITTDFIPEISKCEYFSEPLLTKILSDPQEDNTNSYALQFKAPSTAHIEIWIATTGINKLNALQTKHGENILYFATFMDILHQ